MVLNSFNTLTSHYIIYGLATSKLKDVFIYLQRVWPVTLVDKTGVGPSLSLIENERSRTAGYCYSLVPNRELEASQFVVVSVIADYEPELEINLIFNVRLSICYHYY